MRRARGKPKLVENSPTTVLIRHHYEKSGIDKGWTRDQVNRLCAVLKITKKELAALFCIDWPAMLRWEAADHYPPYVALHFVKALSYFDSCVLSLKVKPDAHDKALAAVVANTR